MALIKCPECGAQVSSNVKQCVHCGCKYSVCPECGGIHVGELKQCPTCGNQLAAASFFKSGNNNGNTDSAIGTDVLKAWESRSATDKTVMKAIKWTNRVLYALIIVLALIVFLIIELWDTKTLDSLLKISEISGYAHGLIIMCCIVFGLAFIIDKLKMMYSQVLCGAWLRKKGIDISPQIKKASGQVEMSELPQDWDYDNLSSAAYLAAAPNDKSIRITEFILCCITSTATAVCAGIFLTQNADQWLLTKLTGADFVFRYAALIPAVIFAGLYYLTTLIAVRVFSKRKEAWLESEIF